MPISRYVLSPSPHLEALFALFARFSLYNVCISCSPLPHSASPFEVIRAQVGGIFRL